MERTFLDDLHELQTFIDTEAPIRANKIRHVARELYSLEYSEEEALEMAIEGLHSELFSLEMNRIIEEESARTDV